jgi:hypothetical protein
MIPVNKDTLEISASTAYQATVTGGLQTGYKGLPGIFPVLRSLRKKDP